MNNKVKKYKEYKESYVVIGTISVAGYSKNPAYSNPYLYLKSRKIRKRFKTKEEAENYLNTI